MCLRMALNCALTLSASNPSMAYSTRVLVDCEKNHSVDTYAILVLDADTTNIGCAKISGTL